MAAAKVIHAVTSKLLFTLAAFLAVNGIGILAALELNHSTRWLLPSPRTLQRL
ncbi:hypothetical protein OH492_08265 [Vibrio chagasii]|nr:hypothetical protein [Vibrio chagasii]